MENVQLMFDDKHKLGSAAYKCNNLMDCNGIPCIEHLSVPLGLVMAQMVNINQSIPDYKFKHNDTGIMKNERLLDVFSNKSTNAKNKHTRRKKQHKVYKTRKQTT